MATQEELIIDGIASMLKMPKRNFTTNPLAQDEITAIIETCIDEVNNHELEEDLRQFYLSVIEYLKAKILFN